jgi:carboxymethylenebutenolidase
VKEYPDAGHSFLNRHDPADVSRTATVYMTLFSVVGRNGYQEAPAQDARRRILAFFNDHLRD